MRELTVRIKFTKDCLGNVKKYVAEGGNKWPVFYMPRTPDGCVRFEAKWWQSNIRFAADVLSRHHKAVQKIHFDINVDGKPNPDVRLFYKRHFNSDKFVKHEAFKAGEIIGINCIVPSEITDDDFWRLMDLVGRFKGVSPFGPKEFGFFVVESVQRRVVQHGDADWDRLDESTNLQGRQLAENTVEVRRSDPDAGG
jgi:hypothetical protein